jgi:hypothetical protein
MRLIRQPRPRVGIRSCDHHREGKRMGHVFHVAVLTVIAGAALGLGTAGAASSQYPTVFTKFKYELQGGKAEFKGRIDSRKGGCVPDRKVRLYRKRHGSTTKLGGDRTNQKGKFAIDLGGGTPKDGTYYAKVKQAKIGAQGNKKTCLDRKSPSVKLSR